MSRESEAREVLARAYEAATDAPAGSGHRFHAANVRVMEKRDYADWKDRAAIAAMLEFRRATLEEAAAYLDGYAGGHYMAQSCASVLRSLAAPDAEGRHE